MTKQTSSFPTCLYTQVCYTIPFNKPFLYAHDTIRWLIQERDPQPSKRCKKMQEDARRCKKMQEVQSKLGSNFPKYLQVLHFRIRTLPSQPGTPTYWLHDVDTSSWGSPGAQVLEVLKSRVSIWFTGPEKFTHHPSTYGGFLKWEYPQIIRFHRMFHCKPSILGYPHCRKLPYPFHDRRSAESVVQSNKNWTECQHFPKMKNCLTIPCRGEGSSNPKNVKAGRGLSVTLNSAQLSDRQSPWQAAGFQYDLRADQMLKCCILSDPIGKQSIIKIQYLQTSSNYIIVA